MASPLAYMSIIVSLDSGNTLVRLLLSTTATHANVPSTLSTAGATRLSFFQVMDIMRALS